MDKVTHFLLLLTLVLVIMVCSLWLFSLSCASGYVATHSNTIGNAVGNAVEGDNIAEAAGDVRERVEKGVQSLSQRLGNIASSAGTALQNILPGSKSDDKDDYTMV